MPCLNYVSKYKCCCAAAAYITGRGVRASGLERQCRCATSCDNAHDFAEHDLNIDRLVLKVGSVGDRGGDRGNIRRMRLGDEGDEEA